MQGRLTCLVLLGATIATLSLYHPRVALATSPERYKTTVLAVGRFGEIDVFNQHVPPVSEQARQESSLWLSLQKTKGSSDLYVQSNVWLPGGSTGWHSHSGDSLIIVTEGAVTDYDGNDPDCKPHLYTQGMGFVDPGGEHVHILRNEGKVEAKTIAVQLTPANAARRVDVADPGNCHFR